MFQPVSLQYLDPFTTIPDARSKIISALGNTLGDYAPGIKAIYAIINPDTDPPITFKTSELECFFFPPTLISRPLHQNALIGEIWGIRLIQHNRKKDTMEGYKALLKCYPHLTRNSLIAANRDLNEQLNLSISFPSIVRN